MFDFFKKRRINKVLSLIERAGANGVGYDVVRRHLKQSDLDLFAIEITTLIVDQKVQIKYVATKNGKKFTSDKLSDFPSGVMISDIQPVYYYK